VEWKREKSIREHGFKAFFRITWLWRKEETTPPVAANHESREAVGASAPGPQS
jgi:hypothetical protein